MKQTLNKAMVLELVDGVLRSWWTIVAGLCLGLACAFVSLHFSSPVYEATTKIYVTPQKIPEGYIRSTVDDDMSTRLKALQEEVQSRPYMLKLIEEAYGLPASKEEQQKLIEAVRGQVLVESRGWRYFEVTFRDTDPVRTARVANLLADHYIEQNARFRSVQAGETTEALEALAEEALQKLRAKEKQVSEFKRRHPHSTGDRVSANLQILRGRQIDLEANEKALELAKERLTDLRAQWEREQRLAALDPLAVSPSAGDSFAARERALMSELQSLRLRYSERHPEVQAKQRELELLRAEAAAAGSGGSDEAGTTDPLLQAAPTKLEDTIRAAEREIDRLTAERSKIRSDIAALESRVEAAPEIQRQLDDLAKDLPILQAQYNDLRGKVESARGAQLMEEAQYGRRFEVIERAEPPAFPATPNPPRVFALSVIAGLAVFVGPLLVRRILSPVVSSESAFKDLSDVPVMISIPDLPSRESQRRKARRRMANFGLSAASVSILVTVLVILGQAQTWVNQ